VVTPAARLGCLIGVSAFLLCPVLKPPTVTASRSELAATAAHQTTPIRDDREDGGDPSVDFYGNDVTDAVAKYTLDAGGSLYELHSPRTELLRLAAPKT
jgi:hypothetical protein